MERHEVVLSKSAARELGRIGTRTDRAKIVAILGRLVDDPRPFGAIKLVTSLRSYRVRVGKYRIVYEIFDERRIVDVIRIGHRRDVYE